MANFPTISSSSTPEIILDRATESEIPTLVALQYKCFSGTLVEQIANPDTPANQKSTIENHRQHMRDDPGLRIVKAIARSSSVDAGGSQANQDEEVKIVGFCMFYFPTIADDGKVVQPTPLRPRKLTAPPTLSSPAAMSTDANLPAKADPAASSTNTPGSATTQDPPALVPGALAPGNPATSRIDFSRTNLPSLLPHRWSLAASLSETSSPESVTPGGAGYVRYMCVDPSYRRYGIGRRMMEWGCQQYDAEMVDVYLEATAEGEPLYRKFGFEKMSEQVLEIDGLAAARYPIMWRQARKV